MHGPWHFAEKLSKNGDAVFIVVEFSVGGMLSLISYELVKVRYSTDI